MKLLKSVTAAMGLLVGATAAMVVPLAVQPASAAPAHAITCTSLHSESSAATFPADLAGCSRLRTTGGSGTVVDPNGTFLITWSTSKTVGIHPVSVGFISPGRCTPPLTELDFTGTVTGSSRFGKQFAGAPVVFDGCVTNPVAVVNLIPGTTFTIG
jgi:hypothetical protein